MKNKICLIFPYFGKFNNYFNLWLHSAAMNDLIDFYIVTDINFKFSKEYKNIFVVKKTLSEIKDKAKTMLNFDCRLENAYKLCDYKPIYNILFDDIVIDYEYWGYGDMDLIFGDLNSFVMSNSFKNKLCVFHLGHLSFFKNDYLVNDLNRLIPFDKIKEVYTTDKICFFDEREYSRYMILKDKYPDRVFDDYLLIADISPVYSFLWPPYEQYKKLEPQRYVFHYKDGKIAGYFVNKEGDLIKENFVYIHIMRRKMVNNVKNTNEFIICPNRFLDFNDEFNRNVYEKYKNIDLYSNIIRFKDRVKNKIKRTFNHEK